MVILPKEIYFPPISNTDPGGLYAIGGDLSPERLLAAYKHGIFPWFNEDEPICWYSPDPRFILSPGEVKISKSMKALIKKEAFSFTVNKAFDEVIYNCQNIVRNYGPGSWISGQIIQAYKNLAETGVVESAEVWDGDKLAGGLYGVKMGKVFFGESMFSKQNNASKFAFIKYIDHLKLQGIKLIDCQVYSEHLESLGAKLIPRDSFLNLLEEYI